MGDTRTPVKVSVSAMAFNCTLAFLLAPSLGHVGLALAIAAASTLNAIVLMVVIRRRLPGKPIPGARRAWLRVAAVLGRPVRPPHQARRGGSRRRRPDACRRACGSR